MKVYRLIYSKTTVKKSPRGFQDFHTIFYPLELMNDDDILALESKIHFPGSDLFDIKYTVFYQNIKGSTYLIILHMKNLPDDRDEFGRSGLFLVQGFIFPPDIWRNTVDPLSLLSIIKEFLFRDREHVFKSTSVNWETGDISPIEISEGEINVLKSGTLQPLDNFEIRLAILLNKLARNKGREPILLLKGTPDMISTLISKLFPYVPEALRIYIGWESALDRGNLNFYPIKIAGFSRYPPVGGNPINIDIETQNIEESIEKENWFKPETPYEKWLYEYGTKIQSYLEIEEAYALSLLIEEGKIPQRDIVIINKEYFAEINKELIENAFCSKVKEITGLDSAKYISSELQSLGKLDLLIEETPIEKILDLLENIIIKNRLTSNNIKIQPQSNIKEKASPRLRLILKLFNGEDIGPIDMNSLNNQERYELIRYLFLTGWGKELWFSDILKNSRTIFDKLINDSEAQKIMEELVKRELSKYKEYKLLIPILIREALKQNCIFELFTGEIDPLNIIENLLEMSNFNEEDLNLLTKWAKYRKYKGIEPPFVKSILYPERGINKEVLKNNKIRPVLIKKLIKEHNFNISQLKEIGFEDEEITMAEKKVKGKSSFIQKIKKIFTFEKRYKN